jgi:hypothetical protein
MPALTSGLPTIREFIGLIDTTALVIRIKELVLSDLSRTFPDPECFRSG